VPGVTAGFQYPVQMRFNELMTGARQDVVCKIFGEDLDTLAAYSNQLGNLVSTVQGARDLYVESVTGLPQIVISYNRDALAHYQLHIEDVNRVIRTAFAGESAGMIYENERKFDLVVRLDTLSRRDLMDVRNLLIPSPTGSQVPLYQVAAVDIREGPNQIQREDAKRRIVVGFNVRGKDVQSVVNELSRKVDQQLKLPSGYYITYGGQFENLIEARKRLSIALPLALLLIFVMLYFAFGKLKYGVLIFSAIPLSAIGGILGLWFRGMPFSISAGVGFIALFGVAVLNGIVLITEFNRLKNQDMHDLKFIIMEGTKVRLRPVLMTAFVASLGFLPMAISQGAGAEVQRPLATVVIGGLISATFLTLVLLPILYMWMEREKPGKSKKKKIPIAVLILCLVLSAINSNAQFAEGKPMKLEPLLEMARQQNLSLSAIRKESDYWKQMQSSVYEIPRTLIGTEYGNINSLNNDTRFQISQSFAMPLVYKRQKAVYSASEKTQDALLGLKEQELSKEIKILFWQMADMLERNKVLTELDSLYARQYRAANLRLQAGESNRIEKLSSAAEWQQIKLQEEQLRADFRIRQEKMMQLLHTRERLIPDYSYREAEKQFSADSIDLASHPLIRYRAELVKLAASQTMLEKNRMLPEWAVGYNNMSISGYQSTDGVNQRYFGAGQRFSSYNLTLSLPLFNKTAKNKVKAGQINEAIAGIQVQLAGQELNSRLMQLKEEHRKWQQFTDYYKKEGREQAVMLMEQARISYEKGETGYLEWALLTGKAISIRLGELDALLQQHLVQTEIEYLTGK